MYVHQRKSFASPKSIDSAYRSIEGSAKHIPVWMNGYPLHRKLTINQAGDTQEQEADRVANEVMRSSQPPHLQRKSDGVSGGDAPPSVHQTLNHSGRPLDAGTRGFMESCFGQDFSGVRVHTGEQAAQSAAEVSARAYTVGNNVVFGAGQYNPSSDAGKQLLAHELTHTVQQSSQLASSGQGMRLQRDDTPLAQSNVALPSLVPPVNLPTQSTVLQPGESPTADNPKLRQLASAYKASAVTNPQAYITLSATLPENLQYDTQKAKAETSRLWDQLRSARDALQSLGVPRDQIDIEPPTTFASSLTGQVQAELFARRRPLPSYSSSTPPWLTPLKTPPASAPTPSLSELLTFKFKAGAFEGQVELPKSVTAKLALPLGGVYSMGFELKADVPGDFAFGITFNGLRYIKVALKAGFKYDKDQGTSGSAGLEITTTKTVCNADNPELLKAKIIENGEKLKKALDELPKVASEDRIGKLFDIGGAIAGMYDAVDKSKQACKEVPAATFNFGLQGPISPSDKALEEPDPLKRPSTYLGGSITIPF